jgi:hypothetical protein
MSRKFGEGNVVQSARWVRERVSRWPLVAYIRRVMPSSGLMLLAGLSLLGCERHDRDAPDPFYLQISNFPLAIPKAYVHAGSGIDTPPNRDELRLQATTRPGVSINTFYMVLNVKTLKPYIEIPNQQGIPDYLRVWISDVKANHRWTLDQIWASRIFREARLPSRDQFGLTAYAREFQLESPVNFLVQQTDGSKISFECTGFGLPNPTCPVEFMWNGLIVRYDLRYIYLSDWQKTQKRMIELLDSFTYAEKTQK